MNIWIIIVSAWWLLGGCIAKNAKTDSYPEYPNTGAYGYDGQSMDAPAASAESTIAMDKDSYEAPITSQREESKGGSRGFASAPRKAAPPQAAPPPPGQPVLLQDPSPAEQKPPATAAAERMVHYDGWMSLRVANPREALEAAIKLAEGLGGRTERLAGNTVTLRVPVAKFEEAFKALLALGDVTDKSIRADDVTEAFTAIDLRADTLRATQKRLIALLAKAKDEEEKLLLLTELTRVTTELDALESQLRTLSDLASMSRITLQAQPREAFQAQGGRPSLAGFEWIASLSPFNRAVWGDDHRVALPVPEGLVALTPKGPFVAESADGTVIWTLRLPNDPVGSGAFWLASVQDRLASEFAVPEPSRVRSWDCLSMLEPGADEPYRWQICVKPEGNKLHVAQVFYPNKAQFERYGAAIEAALSAGGES